MSLAEDILEKVKLLPEDKQTEILDFIDFIAKKMDQKERREWSQFSLEEAMRGLDTEETLYTVEDIREKF